MDKNWNITNKALLEKRNKNIQFYEIDICMKYGSLEIIKFKQFKIIQKVIDDISIEAAKKEGLTISNLKGIKISIDNKNRNLILSCSRV